MKARVAVIVSARPSWAKLQTVVESLRENDLAMDLVACAYALIHRFGRVVDVMRAEGFTPTTEIASAVDGNTLDTSVQTMALTALHVGEHLKRTKPTCVVMVADRHETLALAAAASFQNIPLVHLQGGEVSGNIDHKVRWANSMLADWHAVATAQAREKLIAAGLPRERVWWTGCPSIDLAHRAVTEPLVTKHELGGTGADVDPCEPFTLLAWNVETERPTLAAHALVTAYHEAAALGRPVIAFWPGPDAGQEEAAKVLRMMQPHAVMRRTRLLRTLPPSRFLRLLSQATEAIGNSSALVREASYLGVPVILLGDRQRGREQGVVYGDGAAGGRVAEMVRAACQAGEYTRSDVDDEVFA